MPITLKKTTKIFIHHNTFTNGKKEEPLKQEKEKVKILELKTKVQKVSRQNG